MLAQRVNSQGERYVIGPTGTPLTLADLPPAAACCTASAAPGGFNGAGAGVG